MYRREIANLRGKLLSLYSLRYPFIFLHGENSFSLMIFFHSFSKYNHNMEDDDSMLFLLF